MSGSECLELVRIFFLSSGIKFLAIYLFLVQNETLRLSLITSSTNERGTGKYTLNGKDDGIMD